MPYANRSSIKSRRSLRDRSASSMERARASQRLRWALSVERSQLLHRRKIELGFLVKGVDGRGDEEMLFG